MKRLALLALLVGSLLMICLIPPTEYSSGSQDSGYTVSFNADGGTGTMDDYIGITGDFFLPECGFTAPPDMQFRCWLVGGENKDPYDKIAITADTEITARWTGIANWMGYTVSFNANGGTGTMDITYASGWYEIPDCGFGAPEGKTFRCWTDGGNGHYQPHDHIGLTFNITFTAQWIVPGTYAVTFDANGGSGFMYDALDLNGEYTLPENGFYPPHGKTFVCWSVDDVQKNPGDKINVTGDTTVKAVWSQDDALPINAGSGDDDGHLSSIIAATVAGVAILIAAAFILMKKE